LAGDQTDQWSETNLDLATYVGTRVRLRFRGVTGSGFTSDITLDDVTVDASFTPPAGVPTDVQLPGTQPSELVNDVAEASDCSLCHQGYSGGNPLAKPSHGWGGSMMAHASRDPLFWGAMAVTEQDFAGSGDLCLRCHVPKGWLAGRSDPTDGSALLDSDADGVQCALCHRLTNPDDSEHVGVQNMPFIANDGGAPATAFVGNGMYVMWDQNSKLGPYADASAPHGWLQSNLHRSDEACGTCHDVSNPVTGDLAHNNGAQIPLDPGDFSDVLGGPVADKAAFLNFPHEYGAVERTFSEYKAGLPSQTLISDFATLPADLQAGSILAAYDAAILAGQGGDYADGTPRTFTCQACHMQATAGEGCSQNPGIRNDLPTHDLTGGNYWVPDAIEYLDGLGQLRLGGGLSATQLSQLDAGQLRAQQMLNDSASLEVNGDTVKVINLTGHKLITGYPEGRRMWLAVQYFDDLDVLIDEVGAYGQISADIDGVPTPVETLLDPRDPDLHMYEVHNAITQEWATDLLGLGVSPTLALTFNRETGSVTNTLADVAGQAPGTWLETNHFVLNNYTSSDTRIPPFGMTYDDAAARNALPVPDSQFGNPGAGGTYDYWHDAQLNPPPGAVSADITLYYQPTSWEYIQFLDLANDGSNAFLADEGTRVLDAWLNTGMAAPYAMATTTWNLVTVCGDGVPEGTEQCDDGAANGTTTCGCANDCTYPIAATPCDNGTVCDGAETCDGAGTCTAGTPLICDNGQFCDGSETCGAVLGCLPGTPPAIDDGVLCTVDSCDEAGDTIVNSPSDALCNNTLFCDGTETCDALLDCQAGMPPSIDDGVACTDDSCDENADVIVNTANDANCDNGLFCDGTETCDAQLDCQAGMPPSIDDGVACTDDSCDEVADGVVNATNDALCDNGIFCDGSETCDALLDCQAGSDPCPSQSCDEGLAVCGCLLDADCTNGLFCDGSEVCSTGVCLPGTPPVIDDGIACTDDSCDEGSDLVVNIPNDASCDNGLFCDGAEWCEAATDCQTGTPPTIDDGITCTDDVCDEAGDVVVNTENDANCDDGDACTADACDAVLGCSNTPIGGCLAGFTAYNDCVYDATVPSGTDPKSQTVHYTTANVTTFGIGSVAGDYLGTAETSSQPYTNSSGELLDHDTGISTGVTATFTQNLVGNGVIWQPQVESTWTGGYDTADGTDADDTFGDISDMTGTIHYANGTGWNVDLTLTGLDPNRTYTFATTASRAHFNTDGTDYSDRVTTYTLMGADLSTNDSTVGVTEISPTSVSFSTGNNHAEGYVARWKDIDPGADGTITIRAEPDMSTGTSGNEHKAYTFDVFQLIEQSPPPQDLPVTDHLGQIILASLLLAGFVGFFAISRRESLF
jgi:hypothetical protein